jgi:hypothetical protein
MRDFREAVTSSASTSTEEAIFVEAPEDEPALASQGRPLW